MNLSLKPIADLFHRFHVVIFVVVVFGSLTLAVYILSTIVHSATNTTAQDSTTLNTSFDQETIRRIEELKARDEASSTVTFPSGRINPFAE